MRRNKFNFTSDDKLQNYYSSDVEEMHLRKLLQDNILKAEKENWEIVSKEIENELKGSKHVKSDTAKQTKVQTLNRKIQPLKVKQSGSLPSDVFVANCNNVKQISGESVFCKRKSDYEKHSRVLFLNHLQSSIDASKKLINKQNMSAKYSSFAVPIAPPNQEDCAFRRERLHALSKEQIKKTNCGLYHFTSRDCTANLTTQTLPAISIHDERNNSMPNIHYEEIKEVESAPISFKKTKSPPATSSQEYVASYPDSDGHKVSLSHRNELKIHQSEKPILPSTENCCLKNHVLNVLDEKSLKSIVTEILNDMQITPFVSHQPYISQTNALMKESGDKVPGSEKHTPISHSNGYGSLQSKRNYSILSQDISFKSPNNLKKVIPEVIMEISETASDSLQYQSVLEEKIESYIPNKNDKEIQTNLWIAKDPVLPRISNETQASIFQKSDILPTDDATEATFVPKQDLNEDNLILKKNAIIESDISQQLAIVTSRVENLINSFNNHIFKLNDVKNTEPIEIPKSDHIQAVCTREVSLQCSPYLISQSVNTSQIKVFEKASQCDDTRDEAQPVITHSCTQTESNSPDPAIQVLIDVATQSNLTVADVSAQTEEIVLQISEHSTNTSVSSTPVSDSLFLDDILSEGEIPWHLKLSYLDKNMRCSSSIDAESTSVSKDKDFSLSEGEISSRFILQDSTAPMEKDVLVAECKHSWNSVRNGSIGGNQFCGSCSKTESISEIENPTKESLYHLFPCKVRKSSASSFVVQRDYSNNQENAFLGYDSLEQISDS